MKPSNQTKAWSSNEMNKVRRGTVIPLVAISSIAMFAFVALALDIGIMTQIRSDCQNAADAASLAGTRQLNGLSANNNLSVAVSTATSVAESNNILTQAITSSNISAITPGIYSYNSTSQRFEASFPVSLQANQAWTALQVSITNTYKPIFGKMFGLNSTTIGAQATAVYRPRDLALILDFSGSMQMGTQISEYYVYDNNLGDYNTICLNPDMIFPEFGPWSIFSRSDMILNPASPGTVPSNLNTYQPPNPMQRVWPYEDSSGYIYGPSNMTTETEGGPAMVSTGFVLSDQSTNAFVGPYATGTFPTFYNVNDTANAGSNPTGLITPVPATYANQTTTGFVGDPFPYQNGVTVTAGTLPTPDKYAQTVADYLGLSRSRVTNSTKNATFEKYGYDWDFSKNALKPVSSQFQGFTVGPGYYGKTFYMWPPDPRAPVGTIGSTGYVAGDWRRRFFNVPSGSSTSTQDNSIFWNSNGMWTYQYPGYQISEVPNYTAILQWIKAGPQVFPSSLQSGRVVYYNSIPSSVSVDNSTGYISGSPTNDQIFWKDYIDFVLGTGNYWGQYYLYGVNPNKNGNVYASTPYYYNKPNSSNLNPKITQKSWSGSPYMNYTDSPVHPRLHFWFGPLTLLAYLQTLDLYGVKGNWNPGTCYESQDWQLKAGVSAAFSDMQNNHPNDLAALIYFNGENNLNSARVQMSNNYTLMTNCLYYPYNLLGVLSDPTQTITPFTFTSPQYWTPSGIQDNSVTIPNAITGTDPSMGFMIAYNELSSANGYNGRVGATKVVIFETDGIPNTNCNGNFNNNGANFSYYNQIGNSYGTGNSQDLQSQAKTQAMGIVQQITAMNTAASPGYSTSRQPAYVHSLGFGFIFEPAYANAWQTAALNFLYAVQVYGNTCPTPGNPSWATAGLNNIDNTPYSVDQSYKLITGPYATRIANLQQAMQRIMQGGVQIALIQ